MPSFVPESGVQVQVGKGERVERSMELVKLPSSWRCSKFVNQTPSIYSFKNVLSVVVPAITRKLWLWNHFILYSFNCNKFCL